MIHLNSFPCTCRLPSHTRCVVREDLPSPKSFWFSPKKRKQSDLSRNPREYMPGYSGRRTFRRSGRTTDCPESNRMRSLTASGSRTPRTEEVPLLIRRSSAQPAPNSLPEEKLLPLCRSRSSLQSSYPVYPVRCSGEMILTRKGFGFWDTPAHQGAFRAQTCREEPVGGEDLKPDSRQTSHPLRCGRSILSSILEKMEK